MKIGTIPSQIVNFLRSVYLLDCVLENTLIFFLGLLNLEMLI